MKKLLLAFFIAFLPAAALATPTDWVIDFTPPAIRADGDPLPSAEILEYRFYLACSTVPTLLLTVPNLGVANVTVDAVDGQAFSLCFTTVDTDLQEGTFSVSSNFLIDFIAQPGAGNINSVTITCTAQRCKIVPN